MARDYYNLLGVPRSASEREVRAAFRRLARKHHPDLNPGQPDAAERFKEINEAHEVLSNAESRRLYDRFGDNWKQAQQFGQQGPPGAGHVRWGPGQAGPGVFDDLLGDFDLGDVFGRFIGGGRGGVGTASRPRVRPATLEQPVELTLEEAHDGAVRAIQVTRQTSCASCEGRGRAPGGMCPVCLGRGFTFQPTRGEARIPPGVESGSRVRVSAGGQEVLLVITVRPDPRFRRSGADLDPERLSQGNSLRNASWNQLGGLAAAAGSLWLVPPRVECVAVRREVSFPVSKGFPFGTPHIQVCTVAEAHAPLLEHVFRVALPSTNRSRGVKQCGSERAGL